MEVQVNFKVINPEYNQDYANEYNGGEEGESNWKYLLAITRGVDNVKSASFIEDDVFTLKGTFIDDDSSFELKIPNVRILRCLLEDNSLVDFAVSKSILKQTHQAQREGYNVLRFYFYINHGHAVKLSDNLFVHRNEIPPELAESENKN